MSTSLRPKANFKPQKNNVWTIALNDQVYSCGPVSEFEMLSDDDPCFYWQKGDVKHPARSMFQALVGILQDFCQPA